MLMTEFENEYDVNRGARLCSNVRLATIETVEVSGKYLVYSARIRYDFGRVVVDNYKSLGDRIFFHQFEAQRTHWAIKDVSVEEVITAFGLASKIDPVPVTPPPPPPPQPGALEHEQSVTSVEEFLKKINEFQAEGDHEAFYRGHSDYHRYIRSCGPVKNWNTLRVHASGRCLRMRRRAEVFLWMLKCLFNPLVAVKFSCPENGRAAVNKGHGISALYCPQGLQPVKNFLKKTLYVIIKKSCFTPKRRFYFIPFFSSNPEVKSVLLYT